MLSKKNFKSTNFVENKINNNLFFKINKSKVKFYTASNIYYKKIYKTIKIFSSALQKCDNIRFNIVKIKTILFNKQSKEYVLIIKYLNLTNILYFFYK